MKPKYRIQTLRNASSIRILSSALLILGSAAHAQTNNYFGTTGTLSGNVWSTIPAGPYTSALDATGGAIINFGNATTAITGATITVAGINATANATITTAGGTITNQGNAVIPIDVASGFALDFGGQSFTSSGTAGYIKNGAGTLALAGNTYGGGFTLNAGTVAVGGVNAMGDGGTLTINGGTIRSNGTTARDFTGKYDTGIVVAADFALGDTVSFGALTFSNDVTLGAATRTITARSTSIFSGIISASPGVGLIKEGAGAIVLAGTANTYDGSTTINAGTLSFRTGAADGASTYTFGASSTIGLGLGTGGFTPAEVVAIFAGTVPASLPNVTINAATNISLDTTGTAGVNFASAIAPTTRGLEKIGAGANLTLSGLNQYSGRTVVGYGSAMVASLGFGNIADTSSNVGTNSTIDLLNGARIDASVASSSDKNFNAVGSSTIFAGTGALVLSGTISTETAGSKTVSLGSNAALTVANTMSGTISNGSGTLAVTKINGGRWILSGNNTYSGGTTLSAGVLDINSATAIGTGTLTTGATIDNTSGSPITLSTNNAVNLNNFTFTGTNALNLGTGAVSVAGTRTLTVTANTLTFGGILSGGATGIVKNGAGTLALTGSANTITGRNTLNTGVLEVSTMSNYSAASSLGAQSSADGLWIAGGATLRYIGSADVTTNRGFTLSTSGGSIIESSGAGTLSFDTPANTLAYNTTFQPRGLVLGGSNIGGNTFGKNLADNGSGSTRLTSNFAIGATTITLDSVVGITVGAPISATGIPAATTVTAIDPITRVVTLSAAATVAGTAGLQITVTGVVNPSTLTKNGAGSWTLSSTSNTYTGATTVTAGTLRVGANNVLPNASAVSIGAATLDAATFTDTLGTLDATSTATINLGTGAALAFANSSAIDWTGGTLTLTGTFVSGVSLRFGTDATGLTPAQLASISATGFTSFALDSSGFLTATPVGGSPYDTWSGSLAFDADTNGDGISNGMAWLLGAASPTASATALLPVVTQTSGNLVLTFSTLNAASRGTATVTLQHSSDLGLADPWFSVSVPESTSTVSGVTFSVTADGTMNDVIATIPASEAAAGKLFGRIIGQTAP